MIDSKTLLILIQLINMLFILWIVFLENKSYRFLIFWILFFLALPVISWAIYFVYHILIESFNNKEKRVYDTLEKEINKMINVPSYVDEKNSSIIELCKSISFSPCSINNHYFIFNSINEYYNDLFKEILNARKSIYIEMYIIQNDEIGNKLLSLLKRKLSEGVNVVLLYDRFGSIRLGKGFFDELVSLGGEVYSYYPNTLIGTIFNLNIRNHRKNIVIDSKIAYLGGANIGREYISKHKRIRPWRDLEIKLEGDIVLSLLKQFYIDYNFCLLQRNKLVRIHINEYEFLRRKNENGTTFQMVSSSIYFEEGIGKCIISLLHKARSSIYIETPYFVPSSSLFETIKIMIFSGVRVVLVIPKIYDKKIPYRVSEYYASEIMKLGGEVYLYKGFIHSKMIVVDEELSLVGSSNFDIRSLTYNKETSVISYSKNFALSLIKIFQKDIKNSEKCSLKKYYSSNYFVKLERKIFFLFSQIM